MATSCSSVHGTKEQVCNENPVFEQAFHHNVDVVEKYSQERLRGTDQYTVTPDDFLKSLKFISVYTKVSMGEVLNYETGYPNYALFQKEKNNWDKWYKANRCKNIQIIAK